MSNSIYLFLISQESLVFIYSVHWPNKYASTWMALYPDFFKKILIVKSSDHAYIVSS